MKTTDQWLALPDDKLALELGRVFTPGPWKHCLSQNDSAGVTIRCCSKCDKQWYVDEFPKRKPCFFPNPIKLDWNTAMEWRDKIFAGRYSTEFATRLLEVFGGGIEGDIDECFAKATCRDYLITAAMAVERNKE